MKISVDRERAAWGDDIRRAQDREFRAVQDRDAAEREFAKAVGAVGVAKVEVTEARARLVTFEASLCTSCGCLKDDHATAEGEDPRPEGAWVCYGCGRDEECPR